MNDQAGSGEQWRACVDIPGFQVSNIGRVRNTISGEVKRLQKSKGYMRVSLGKKFTGFAKTRDFNVHRLVAEAFIGPSCGMNVNHLNGIRDDNRVENLEWATQAENMQHSCYVLGKRCKPVIATELSTGKQTVYASTEMAKRIGGHNQQSVSACALGYKKTHHGHTFSYDVKAMLAAADGKNG